MREIIFYTNPQSRGRIVRWMLEECGVSYDTKVVGYGSEMKSDAYLSINPMGKVPPAERGLLAMDGPKINFQVRSSNESLLACYRHIGYVQDDVVSLGRRLIPDA